MKIGIMSMHRVANYGSFLQAYALKKVLEELGNEVGFVDYKVEPPINKAVPVYKRNKIYLGAKTVRNKFFPKKSANKFHKNYTEYLKTIGVSDKKTYHSKEDVLVIGSDEVFNCLQTNLDVGFSKELFGANHQAKKVISYAASFGNTTLEKMKAYNIQKTVGSLLENFRALSVRDRNSYQIVRELTGRTAEIHLDPVLIYNYEKDVKDVVTERDYIVVYAYNRRITEAEGEAIRQFALAQKKKLIAIGGAQTFCDEYVCCSPLEMLSYFKHADYVVTDTFHGTIFSIINHRQFATLIRSDYGGNGYGNEEKLGYLLEKLKLEGRSVKDLKELGHILKAKIDYCETDAIIQEERIRTRMYLKEQLREI